MAIPWKPYQYKDMEVRARTLWVWGSEEKLKQNQTSRSTNSGKSGRAAGGGQVCGALRVQ